MTWAAPHLVEAAAPEQDAAPILLRPKPPRTSPQLRRNHRARRKARAALAGPVRPAWDRIGALLLNLAAWSCIAAFVAAVWILS